MEDQTKPTKMVINLSNKSLTEALLSLLAMGQAS